MKFEKDGQTIEVDNPNTFTIFIREGFVKIEEEKETTKKK